MAEISLQCSCGTVKGTLHDITPGCGTRIVCYCNDCQAFARYLGDEGSILDAYGGTDIFQTTPSQVEITEGAEQIRCMRLTPKGLFRWYTECCKTPISNTMGAGLPFVGMVHNFMVDDNMLDQNLGPVRGYVYGKHATTTPPAEKDGLAFPFRMILRSISKLLVWKLKGLNKPSPFFGAEGKPVSEPYIPNSNI